MKAWLAPELWLTVLGLACVFAAWSHLHGIADRAMGQGLAGWVVGGTLTLGIAGLALAGAVVVAGYAISRGLSKR